MPDPLSSTTGFRHEGRGLAVGVGDLVDDVFVDLHRIAALDEWAEMEAQLVLPRRHFVVMLLHLDAHLVHEGQHLGPQIRHRIDGRHRGNSRP